MLRVVRTGSILSALLLAGIITPGSASRAMVPPAPPASATLQAIQLTGNEAFTSRELLARLSSKVGLLFSQEILENDLRLLVREYRRQGYLHARVALAEITYSSDSSSVELVLAIAEGRQTVVGRLVWEGVTQFLPDELEQRMDTRPGRPLDESILAKDLEHLLERYERIGFPFVQCSVEGIQEENGEDVDSLWVTLRVEEGERVTIEEVRVEGNTDTHTSVVVREARVRMGEIYNPAKVDAIRQRLRRLNIFVTVAEPQLYMRNNRGGLLITVQEGNTNTFDGILGYIPGTGANASGTFTGLVSISMRNVLGTGRKASFRWQRDDRFSQELGLRYLEPWLFGHPVNLGGGFLQRKQDTTYVRRVVDLRSELMLSEELTIGALFSSESIIPSAGQERSRVFRSSTVMAGAELLYDVRDDASSPTAGARYRTDYQYGRKKISNISPELTSRVRDRVTVQRFSLDLEFFLSPFARQVLAFGVHGRELRSGQVEEGEMFRLGGTRTLRGYRENQFLGSRIVWGNTEYRFLLARRSFLYGFVDTGYYTRPADDIRLIPSTDAFKVGYGIGVQLETGLGDLGVSYALGEGDSFTNGKVHVGLINDF